MIATHSLKSLNSTYKQVAIRANIVGIVPAGFLSTKSIPFAYYASPLNAADLGVFSIETQEANTSKKVLDVFTRHNGRSS